MEENVMDSIENRSKLSNCVSTSNYKYFFSLNVYMTEKKIPMDRNCDDGYIWNTISNVLFFAFSVVVPFLFINSKHTIFACCLHLNQRISELTFNITNWIRFIWSTLTLLSQAYLQNSSFFFFFSIVIIMENVLNVKESYFLYIEMKCICISNRFLILCQNNGFTVQWKLFKSDDIHLYTGQKALSILEPYFIFMVDTFLFLSKFSI